MSDKIFYLNNCKYLKHVKKILLSLFFIFLSCKNIYHVNDNICDDGVYEPVCGYNGATFPNSCYAENSGITIYTEGECE